MGAGMTELKAVKNGQGPIILGQDLRVKLRKDSYSNLKELAAYYGHASPTVLAEKLLEDAVHRAVVNTQWMHINRLLATTWLGPTQ